MKVNLGKSEHKKSFFPISLDSSTSYNFGECLPNFCHELPPDSHLNLSIRNGVRFSPLSFPTFGKADLKTYIACHKISDLYPPFLDMLAQTPFSGSTATYVPTEVPTVPLWYLWLLVYTQCDFNFFTGHINHLDDDNNHDGFVFPEKSPLMFSDFSFSPLELRTDPFQVLHDGNVFYTDPNNAVSSSLVYWLADSLSSSPLYNLIGDHPVADLDTVSLVDYLSNTAAYDEFSSRISDGVYSSIFNPIVDPGMCDLLYPINGVNFTWLDEQSILLPVLFMNGFAKDFLPAYAQADHESGLLVKCPTNIGGFSPDKLFVGIRLNNSGKLLRKILMGLGYNLAPLDTPVSILPIIAYFRTYFDLFAPKRFVKYEQSYCYRAINKVVQTGEPMSTALFDYDGIGWSDIVDDLLSCFYTKNTDYYSAQIIGLVNNYGSSLDASYIPVYKDSTGSGSRLSVGNPTTITEDLGNGTPPSLDLSGKLQHTQSQQNVLSRLTQFVNRRSVLGGKLAALLKSVFGISQNEVDEYNAYVGSMITDVEIGDVFSTAETSEASLGEYAGKAIGRGYSDNFNINVDVHSLVLSVSVLVPRTQYVDGLNPILCHSNYMDFYNPMFDGLTLVPSRKSSLYCPNNYLPYHDMSFGNIPIYSEYKTKTQGILSGDLSLPSTRNSFDSFTMDEVISPFYYDKNGSNGSLRRVVQEVNFENLVCGTMWRYLGRWLWLGRFDRIFVNNRITIDDIFSNIFGQFYENIPYSNIRDHSRSDDNIVCHSIIDMKINSPMVPLANSMLTQDINELYDSGITSETE